jgi:CRISPR/Cas system type I-B associated protein Csh2 (Cas7 group RAMP superfamily)
MIKRLVRYTSLISFVGLLTFVLTDVSMADCQSLEKDATKSIVQYKLDKKKYDADNKAFQDYVKIHSFHGVAPQLEKVKDASSKVANTQLKVVQGDYDKMKKQGCLANSKLVWPPGIKK